MLGNSEIEHLTEAITNAMLLAKSKLQSTFRSWPERVY